MAKRLTEKLVLRRSAIYTTPENPADTLIRVYGDLTNGDQGIVPCVVIQKWNGSSIVYQIADHPILNERPTIYVNDVEDTASTWTFNASNNFESKGAVATLSSSVDHSGRQVSVRCKGKLNGLNNLIQNPCEIIFDLLYVTQGITGDFDLVSYSEAADIAAELNLFAAGCVMVDIDPVTIADQILEPYGGADVGSDGKLRLFIEALPQNPIISDDIEEAFIDGFEYELFIDQVVNDIKMQFAFNWRKQRFQTNAIPWDGLAIGEDPTSQLEFKQRTTPETLQAPWIRSLDVANIIVDTILALWRVPRPQITLTIPSYRSVLTQVSDIITFTHRKYPGGSHTGGPGDHRLMRVRQTVIDPSSNRCKIVGSDIGRRLPRELLDETITLSEELIVEKITPETPVEDTSFLAAWVFDSDIDGHVPNQLNPTAEEEDAILSNSNTDGGFLECGRVYQQGANVALPPRLKSTSFTMMVECTFIGDCIWTFLDSMGVNNNRQIMQLLYSDTNIAASIGGPYLGPFPTGDEPEQKHIKFTLRFNQDTTPDAFTDQDYDDETRFFLTLTYNLATQTVKAYISNVTLGTTVKVWDQSAVGTVPLADTLTWGYNPFVPYWFSNVNVYRGYLWSEAKSQDYIEDVVADPDSILPGGGGGGGGEDPPDPPVIPAGGFMRLGGVPRFVLGVYDSGVPYFIDTGSYEDRLFSASANRLINLPINLYLNYHYGEAPIGAMQALMTVLESHGIYYLQTANCFDTGSYRRIAFALDQNDSYPVTFAAHDGAAGFYLVDECVDSLIPETIAHHNHLKALAPSMSTFIVTLARGYVDPRLWVPTGDVIGSDPYPLFGTEPAAGYTHFQVADFIAQLVQACGSKPAISVLQFFKFTTDSRVPTESEYRSHAVMSIVEGAKGIMWWEIGINGIRHESAGVVATEMAKLRTLVQELADLENVLLSADDNTKLTDNSTLYPDPLAGRKTQLAYNIAVEWLFSNKQWYQAELDRLNAGDASRSPMMVNAATIRTKTKFVSGTGYVFAYNYKNVSTSVTFTWHTAPSSVTENKSGTTYSITGSTWSDTFGPYEARIYVIEE